MRYAKTKTRKTVLFSYIPIFTLLTLIVCMGCGGKGNVRQKPTITSHQQKNVDRKVSHAANKASKRPSVAWVCISCNYVSEKPKDMCPACRREKYQLSASLQQAKGEVDSVQKQTNQNLSYSIVEDCPICLDEDAVSMNGAHTCDRCKKSICNTCYKHMQEVNKHFCPLCRYKFCAD